LGGVGATGGVVAAGGSGNSGTGAAAGNGGSATGGTTSSCAEPEKTVCDNGSSQHCGYTYEYWKDQGSGCLTLKSGGFSVEWSNINNLLGRKGLRPGSTNQIVTYEANYQPNGNSYLCVYGWTKNPLIEYYIVDSWGNWRPPGGTSVGTVSSDGGTYDIYQTQRVNQPSIEGTKTFYQYWSVRTQKRTSGIITVANHFDAWASKGMNMGSLYEVSMTVEGYQSSGSANVSMSMK
jgi:endo-1,4-beta-xylanase